MNKRTWIKSAIALVAAAASPVLRAESKWPKRSIRLIVPYAPGGATDVTSRVVAEMASRTLGHPVVVENRPGGASTLGIEMAVKAAPDGYTFICIADSGAYQHLLRPELTWSVAKDLTPISLLVEQPIVIVVHPDLGVDSLQELMALARSGKMQYAVSGTGSTHHLAGHVLAQRAGIRWEHIPYKGGGQAVNDLVAGHVKVGILGSGPVLPQVKAGRLKLLAVTTAARSVYLPEVPTVAESGYSGYNVPQWFGVFAPAGTPSAVTASMQRELAEALKQPQSIETLQSLALETVGSSSKELAQRVGEETKVWADFAKSLKLNRPLS